MPPYSDQYLQSTLANYGIGTQPQGWGGVDEIGFQQQTPVDFAAKTLGDVPMNFGNLVANTPSSDIGSLMKLNMMNTMQNQQGYQQNLDNWNNGWQNQYLKPTLMGLQGLGTLANIYTGFQQLKLAKQQLGMAKEQWSTTKDELNRIKRVRQKLSKQYMS